MKGELVMSKQAELVVKLMTFGVPEDIQDAIGDKIREYDGSGKEEALAEKLIEIIEKPGDLGDILGEIKSITVQ